MYNVQFRTIKLDIPVGDSVRRINTAVLVAAIALGGSGCSNTSTTAPTPAPTPTPASGNSFVYSVPNGNQQITVIEESGFPGATEMTRELNALPRSQLLSLQTLHSSTFVTEIADNIYKNLGPGFTPGWTSIVGTNAPDKEFENFYRNYLLEDGLDWMNGFLQSISSGDVRDAQEFLFMASQFTELGIHQILLFKAAGPDRVPTFTTEQWFYTLTNDVVTIGNFSFGLILVDGLSYVVSAQGNPVPHVMVPPLFIRNANLPPN
jgi:hypothetical protein